MRREIEFLRPITVSVLTERRVFAPRGVAGGGDGKTGENALLVSDAETRAGRRSRNVARNFARPTRGQPRGEELRHCRRGGHPAHTLARGRGYGEPSD